MPRSMRAMQRRAMQMDGRNPYGSEGGYVVSSRRTRGDRLMMEDMRRYNRGESDYELAEMTKQNQEIRHDPYMPRDYETGEVYAGLNDFYGEEDMARNRREMDMARRRRDYARQGGQGGYSRANYGSRADYESRGDYNYEDGHYPMVQGYMPIEAMGRFTGYYGMGEDNARGGRRVRDYARYGRRTYGRDYGYDYDSDDGESLSKDELEYWCKKMMSNLDEREKQMLSKDSILQRAKNMGIEFKNFSELEYYVNVIRNYADHKKSVGENLDMIMKLARDDFFDEDGEYKGSEWLAVYYDTFVDD